MNLDQAKTLLINLLDCGWLDLQALEKIERDFSEIIEYHNDNYGDSQKISLNSLLDVNFQLTLSEINNFIENKIEELEEDEKEDEAEELRTLDAYEDFETFTNFIDTHIWLRNNQDIYEKYEKELEPIFNKCGYSPF
ncbi:hypothetical protein OEJ84_23560 (plasmid) [Bacillus subtilis]|uniref:Uncharacterized protein n=1 Tax=Bacillus phage vB_BsuS_PJN02 TaxID=2920374 RepID=A0AC61TS97_9CAUD|nr:hypothetical protein [Bacillus subtilis]YP_010681841.1 hypothetical protein PQE76_gp223 [Bacillus phage vB_BsuS_PJN02]UNH58566.1 hypothetical protein [Bacillus phage vB_BsuS_PJN02]WOF32879.1 hypothetical protein OEJ84_23560 [Bacillus subtilis]